MWEELCLIGAGAAAAAALARRGDDPPVPPRDASSGVSARVAETVPAVERVPNPRRAGPTESTPESTPESTEPTRRVPETHIVGFRWRQSSESRRRLLERQREEMTARLHDFAR